MSQLEFNKTGEKAVGKQAAIVNRGIFVELNLPDGFKEEVMPTEQPFHYLEFQAPGSMAMICYEETSETFRDEDIARVKKALEESFELNQGRVLDINGNTEDGELFTVLSFCFVFGGFLTRGGTVMDIDRCRWELMRVGDDTASRTTIVGRLKFVEGSGKRSKREVLVVMPQGPGPKGCGYIWLEGNSSDLRRYERAFLAAIGRSQLAELKD